MATKKEETKKATKEQVAEVTEPATEKASGELGSDQVQESMDDATAKGYIGVKADPVPNECYGVQQQGAVNEAQNAGESKSDGK